MNWWGGIVFFILIAAGFAVWGFRQNRPEISPPAEPTSMEKTVEIKIASSVFENNSMIPARFTCDGENVSPPLEISGVPAEAKSLALIMHDPDAPRAGGWTPLEVRSGASAVAPSDLPLTGWTHWVRFNIPVSGNVEQVESYKVTSFKLKEGEEPAGTAGKGTGGELVYQGPCPPSGTHRYFFKIYALDTTLDLKIGATKGDLEKAVAGHIVAEGELIGLYVRQR